MNEIEYCDKINEAISEHFRAENNGDDSDVFVDELVHTGVIALNWHTFLDEYVTMGYVRKVAQFVFDNFADIEQIMSPCEDFKRK